MNFWRNKRVLVTGGTGFIGSHLVEKLVDLGSYVTVMDNFSNGISISSDLFSVSLFSVFSVFFFTIQHIKYDFTIVKKSQVIFYYRMIYYRYGNNELLTLPSFSAL